MKKFFAVIGNPPYQQKSKGANANDTPIYHYFYKEAFKVASKVELITPARFLFNAGGTPDEWNTEMLNDEHFKVLQFKQNSTDYFANQDIKGGVAITYRDSEKNFGAIKVFTTYPELNSIMKKVSAKMNSSIADIVTNRGIYRYSDKAFDECPKEMSKTADRRIAPSCFERMPSLFKKEKPNDSHEYIQILGNVKNDREYRWFRKDYVNETENLYKYKVLVPKANGTGTFGETLSTPVIAKPFVGFTETYISFGLCKTQKEAQAILCYLKTKFLRTMLGLLKVTQNNAKPVWIYVPLQDFSSKSDIDWTKSVHEIDLQLYKKYGLSKEEKDFIETHVKEMV